MLKRHLAKTITYRILSSTVGYIFVYALTGSHKHGMILSLSELLYKPLQYFIHERVWYKYIKYGLKDKHQTT